MPEISYWCLATSGRFAFVIRESGSGADRTTAVVATHTDWDQAVKLARQMNKGRMVVGRVA